MTAATRGYLTDVEYTADFHAHLAPARLAYVAAINGRRHPSLGRFTYCELGCGQGITSLILAATHPAGEFHACDFNAAHVAAAESLRQAGGVDNLHLHARAFAQMLDADVPDFDFIALHGVFSWVPEDVRAEIRTFLQRKLRPGGLVMVSYNAMPGWAHLLPIRRMLRSFAEDVAGDSLEKARVAYARLASLARDGAAYFATNPAAAEHVRGMAAHDIRYVAHEYLTPTCDPFWFDDMAQAMASAGLAFVGSSTPADNYPEICVPEPFVEHVAREHSRVRRESMRDIVANTTFRRDVFAATGDTANVVACLDGLAFCLTELSEELPMTGKRGEVRFDLRSEAPAARAIHGLLSRGPATLPELHAAVRGRAEEDTAFLVQRLVVSGHLAACSPCRPASGWTSLNAALLETAIRDQRQTVPLACAQTGVASDTELVSAAAIDAFTRFDCAHDAGRYVASRLRSQGHPVNRLGGNGERRAATDEEVVAHVAAVVSGLRDRRHRDRRRLELLGILDR